MAVPVAAVCSFLLPFKSSPAPVLSGMASPAPLKAKARKQGEQPLGKARRQDLARQCNSKHDGQITHLAEEPLPVRLPGGAVRL